MVEIIATTLMLLLAPVQPLLTKNDLALWEAIWQQRFIEEHNLQKVRLSCYVAEPGARCADGTIPYEGEISCNWEHMGQTCIMYDLQTLEQVAVWECHDVGGNILLQRGEAIDVYRDSLERCYELVGQYGDYVYIEWLDE